MGDSALQFGLLPSKTLRSLLLVRAWSSSGLRAKVGKSQTFVSKYSLRICSLETFLKRLLRSSQTSFVTSLYAFERSYALRFASSLYTFSMSTRSLQVAGATVDPCGDGPR